MRNRHVSALNVTRLAYCNRYSPYCSQYIQVYRIRLNSDEFAPLLEVYGVLVRKSDPRAVYIGRYAPRCETHFASHPLWQPKLQCNLAVLIALLRPFGNWLVTCYGQGWHLAQFSTSPMHGDRPQHGQLELARHQNPGVPFIQAYDSGYEFPLGQRFDFATDFWSAYFYMNDENKVRALVQNPVRWTAPSGSLEASLKCQWEYPKDGSSPSRYCNVQ